jgi:predicted glycoside hydrolase/deacetylase ChbG (UPF0249 family)
VNQAILKAHEEGIVTSATFLINLPVEEKTVTGFKKAARLGVGLHLNISLGEPVMRRVRVPSLISGTGFRKRDSLLSQLPAASEVALEYQSQIRLFRKFFGRMPTHLDTHHQLHDHPFFLRVLIETAKSFRLPVRRSSLWNRKTGRLPILSSDRLWGDLRPEKYWRKKSLTEALKKIPSGVTEVMSHPGKVDSALRSVTSFTTGRFKEYQVFAARDLRKWVESRGIELTHYGMWYTW